MKRLFKRLPRLWRRRQLDRDLKDELQFHLDMLGQDHPGPRRQFGNVTGLKEACREMWTLGAIEIWWQDIRYAFRTLAKSPGFTAVAVAALALGIGANATVFTLVNGILFKNLPFEDSDRVLYLARLERRSTSNYMSYPDFRDLRAQVKSFEGLAAAQESECNLSDAGNAPQHYRCSPITANTFSIVGLKPVAGRAFLPEDELPGAQPVAILAYSVWETRYGKDLGVVGRSVRLDSVPTTIVGVMPRGVSFFPTESDLWQPLIPGPGADRRDSRDLIVFGRLIRGGTVGSAQAEMSILAQGLAGQYPETNKDAGILVQQYNEMAAPQKIIRVFYVLLGAVAFVLLIACANVANLMLGRAVARAREISIRSALGASRWRVIRQLLMESLILSFAGGAIGWCLAIWGARAFDAAITPTGKPAWIDFSADYRVLAYLTAVSIGAAILFGLAPALRLSRLDVNSVLKDGGRGAGAGRRARFLSSALVVAEMTLAVILLAGAGLMIRSFLKAYDAPMGIDPTGVLTMRVDLPAQRYRQPDDRRAFFQRLKAELEALPGVEAAAFSSTVPGGGNTGVTYEAEGSPPVDEGRRRGATTVVIDQDYFRILRAVIRFGREFAETEGSPAVIVNEAFAARVWPGENALGKRLRMFKSGGVQPWMTVVGVVPDILQGNRLQSQRSPIIYQQFRQSPQNEMYALARTRVLPATLGEAFRRAVQGIDEDQPVRELTTLEDRIKLSNWPIRVFGSMFAIFAVIAFALASVGLYAVIAHSVSQRTHEIGVRMAMGAAPASVLRMVFAHGMRQLAIGLALGLAAAMAVTQLLSSLLVGVSPRDPVTFVSVAVVLLLAGLAGCAIPARRAVRVDPIVTLRCD